MEASFPTIAQGKEAMLDALGLKANCVVVSLEALQPQQKALYLACRNVS